jgi:nucleolar pre-ribosomal-associated protein 2
MQAILSNHRLKLQGHTHIAQQAMQSLLRCLFTPLSRNNTKTEAQFGAQPLWLADPKYQLNSRDAEAFTRLVTSICDPTVSSVKGARHNSLTSEKDKAKRMASLWMREVLMEYIACQLDMRMLPEIREKMGPGLYSIFETTTVESRRVITSKMDSSGRAVYGGLLEDWRKFGDKH